MATSLDIKRKNIDLPSEVIQKLSLMAISQGKSLKSFIESILISKADSLSIEVAENPSPSGDPWFVDPDNIKEVKKGLADIESGKTTSYSLAELKDMLEI